MVPIPHLGRSNSFGRHGCTQEPKERTGEGRAGSRELIPCRLTPHGAREKSRYLHLVHQQGEGNMPSTEPRRQVIHLFKQQQACAGVLLFSVFFPYTASPHKLSAWMNLELAKAFASSHPAKCQHFCRSACFQLPTLLAKRVHPMPACDFGCVADTDCPGKSSCSLESGCGIRCCKHLET